MPQAILEVGPAAFQELRDKLHEAGHGDRIGQFGRRLDLGDIALESTTDRIRGIREIKMCRAGHEPAQATVKRMQRDGWSLSGPEGERRWTRDRGADLPMLYELPPRRRVDHVTGVPTS